jgi:serine/threonine protein kinase
MGTSIARQYVLMGPLGRGGVCEVYHAVDALRHRPLAVKMLAPQLAADRWAGDMVRREAEITDQIRHPSVPRVYGAGDAALPDGTVVPYLALELLRGRPLAGRLAGGPLPIPQALRVAATAADVLAVAHRRGVTHRDLSPANIMLTPGGPKIIDFGLAGAAANAAEDVYGLGVLLYVMLTGRSPYPRSTPAFHRPQLAPTPVLLVPGLPRAVADLCRVCMAKRPGDRPDSRSVALALWEVAINSRAAAINN